MTKQSVRNRKVRQLASREVGKAKSAFYASMAQAFKAGFEPVRVK